MKQAEIRRYRPGERTNPYLAAGWMALLAALLLSGSLLTMQRLWNGRAPSFAAVFAAAALSALCGGFCGETHSGGAAAGARTRSGRADRDRCPRIHCRRPCMAQHHARPVEYGA